VTTLRAIAKKARVSAATIVVHFGDKDELVALLYNEDQRAITEQAYLELSESKGYLDQSIDGFRHYHRYFALYPNFIRAILQTTSLYHPTSMPSRPGRRVGYALRYAHQTNRRDCAQAGRDYN
jgi:AcrR family transcriptional regulator